MEYKITKIKIILILLAISVSGSLAFASLQKQVISVDALLHPIMFVAPESGLAFGLSIPQEVRTAEFVVVAKHTYEGPVVYKVTHARKPLPAGYAGDGEDPNMPGYYRDLCPYLSEVTEENEPDTPEYATLTPVGGVDLVDYWLLTFNVPTIKGYVDQGFVGTPVEAAGDYGCDLKIDLIE